MKEFRVLVCGGRDYSNNENVFKALDAVWGNSIGVLVVIEGGARGADSAASAWALAHEALGVKHEEYKADWTKYGKRAGHIRNSTMLREGKPDLVVAMPGGRGTQNMIKQAQQAGVPVVDGERLDKVNKQTRPGMENPRRAR